MHPEAPVAKRYKLSNGNARARDANPRVGDGIADEDAPESLLHDAHLSVPAGSGSRPAFLPEEILLHIFEHIVPAQYVQHDSYKSDAPGAPIDPWPSSQIVNIALTCRRFHRLILPTLGASFEHWVQRSSEHGGIPGLGPGLRAILRQPVLSTYLRHVDVDMRSSQDPTAAIKSWEEDDYALAEKAVEELCKHDIWKEFPLKIGEGWHAFKKDEKEDQLAQKGAAKHWTESIRAGRLDAIAALLLALAPDIEELTASRLPASQRDQDDEEQASEWEVGGDLHYVQRILRGATNSQLATLNGEAGAGNNLLLPSLLKIIIRTGPGTTTTADVLPFLTLPSLRSASVATLDSRGFNYGYLNPYHYEVIEGGNQWLESLDVHCRNYGCYSASRLLRFCPKVENLSFYSSGDWHNVERGAREPSLIPHLANVAPHLKSLVTCPEGWSDFDPASPGIEQLALFTELTSFSAPDFYLEGLLSGRPTGSLLRALPASIERIKIDAVDIDDDERLMLETNALAQAKEEGLLPNLKEIILECVGEWGASTAQKVFDEACDSAPVKVTRSYNSKF